MIFKPKGFRILDEDGNHICTLSRDVYYYEEILLDDFTDWQIPAPTHGDPIHPAISRMSKREENE